MYWVNRFLFIFLIYSAAWARPTCDELFQDLEEIQNQEQHSGRDRRHPAFVETRRQYNEALANYKLALMVHRINQSNTALLSNLNQIPADKLNELQTALVDLQNRGEQMSIIEAIASNPDLLNSGLGNDSKTYLTENFCQLDTWNPQNNLPNFCRSLRRQAQNNEDELEQIYPILDEIAESYQHLSDDRAAPRIDRRNFSNRFIRALKIFAKDGEEAIGLNEVLQQINLTGLRSRIRTLQQNPHPSAEDLNSLAKDLVRLSEYRPSQRRISGREFSLFNDHLDEVQRVLRDVQNRSLKIALANLRAETDNLSKRLERTQNHTDTENIEKIQAFQTCLAAQFHIQEVRSCINTFNREHHMPDLASARIALTRAQQNYQEQLQRPEVRFWKLIKSQLVSQILRQGCARTNEYENIAIDDVCLNQFSVTGDLNHTYYFTHNNQDILVNLNHNNLPRNLASLTSQMGQNTTEVNVFNHLCDEGELSSYLCNDEVRAQIRAAQIQAESSGAGAEDDERVPGADGPSPSGEGSSVRSNTQVANTDGSSSREEEDEEEEEVITTARSLWVSASERGGRAARRRRSSSDRNNRTTTTREQRAQNFLRNYRAQQGAGAGAMAALGPGLRNTISPLMNAVVSTNYQANSISSQVDAIKSDFALSIYAKNNYNAYLEAWNQQFKDLYSPINPADYQRYNTVEYTGYLNFKQPLLPIYTP